MPIGDVATFAHLDMVGLNKIALAAAKPSTGMTESGAARPIAAVAV